MEKLKQELINLINFESETSEIYPWAIAPEVIIAEKLEQIMNEVEPPKKGDCDTDTLYQAIDKVCGYNPALVMIG